MRTALVSREAINQQRWSSATLSQRMNEVYHTPLPSSWWPTFFMLAFVFDLNLALAHFFRVIYLVQSVWDIFLINLYHFWFFYNWLIFDSRVPMIETHFIRNDEWQNIQLEHRVYHIPLPDIIAVFMCSWCTTESFPVSIFLLRVRVLVLWSSLIGAPVYLL